MKVEIWSDFMCPFCYIGKRRFEAALEQFEHQKDVQIAYKSYELDPSAKKSTDKNIHELLAKKQDVCVEKAKAMNEDIGRQAAEAGLTYNFDGMQYTNTFDAHRVAKYGQAHGKGNEVTERFLKAYFTEERNLSDHDTLVALAEDAGLDAKAVAAMLPENDYASHVRADERLARQIGVQGVPFFVFNEKYAVSGAQPVEVFTDVLEKVWREENKNPVLQILDQGDKNTAYCTDDGCTISADPAEQEE